MQNNIYIDKLNRYDNLIIYGAGKVGQKVYQFLCEAHMENKISCFAISGNCDETRTLYGIPVRSITALSKEFGSALFLIAVADHSYKEVVGTLKEKRVKHFFNAKKLYLASYQINDIEMGLRKIRDKIYLRMQEGKKRSRPKATHITYCRAQNAGDTMLSYCVRQFLPFQNWEIRTVTESINDDVIKQINETNMLVIGGGGLFLPDTNANSISGWQWAISEEQLDRIQVPIIVFAVGYNYFKGQENSELFIRSINALVRKACFIGLRNMGSVRAIREILDPALRDKVVFQPCITTVISKIISVKRKNTKNVGVNIAFDREERRYGENKEKILTEIANAIYEISQLGYKICYIAHCDEDLKFLKYLERLDIDFAVYNLTCALPREVLSCYQRMEIVLGMRGHAQMIPFGVGCKIISLGTHDKMKWFLEDIQVTEWYVDMTKNAKGSHCDDILKIFRKVEEAPLKADFKLQCAQEHLWKISCDNREKIMKTLIGL